VIIHRDNNIIMTKWFSISDILVTIYGYPLSYIEFVGTLTGLFSVWFAARSNILTWPIGLINVACFFIIFFQVHLYSDMFLQAYFFVMSIYGWVVWADKKQDGIISIEILTKYQRIWWALIIVISTIAIGFFVKNIHTILPSIFTNPASYPFIDTFVAVLSIVATILLARKKLENWPLWIIVDIISVGLYARKGVLFISIEYGIFLCLATWGLLSWLKLFANEKRASLR
jgi:nicotinamide mononucleotide transporter